MRLTRSVSLKWCTILVCLRNFNYEISVVLNLAPCTFTSCCHIGPVGRISAQRGKIHVSHTQFEALWNGICVSKSDVYLFWHPKTQKAFHKARAKNDLDWERREVGKTTWMNRFWGESALKPAIFSYHKQGTRVVNWCLASAVSYQGKLAYKAESYRYLLALQSVLACNGHCFVNSK